MREIKFRGWNKEKKIMVYDNEDDSSDYWDGICSSEVGLINAYLTTEYSDKYYYMQYTGLKDKNGKEIYEGDILECTTMQDQNISYWQMTISGLAIPLKTEVKWDNYYSRYDRPDDIKNFIVIGNIYENPNLIN